MRIWIIFAAVFVALSLTFAFCAVGAGTDNTKPHATSQPTSRPASTEPESNLDYWLRQAEPATSRPTSGAGEGINPFDRTGAFRRSDALPGVIELSDGTLLPGGLYTTREKPWIVYVEKEKRWRRIPFIAVRSITAVVEEKMQLEWRWKATGEPERVYTGRSYPTRRFLWKFSLIDGSTITGAVKGQPIRVEGGKKTTGPLVLHERSKGKMGQKLADLVYVKRIFVSRRVMDLVVEHQRKQKSPTSREADDKAKPRPT